MASGAEYRRLSVDEPLRYEGTGVYYGATFVEAQMCQGQDVPGDVRGGNVKRVASAVGEGSIAVSFVHRVLHE